MATSARLRRGFPHRRLLRPSREAAGSGPSPATRGPHCGVPTRLEVTRYRTAAARSPPRRAADPLPTPAGSRQRGSAPRPKIVPRKDAQSQRGLWQKLCAPRRGLRVAGLQPPGEPRGRAQQTRLCPASCSASEPPRRILGSSPPLRRPTPRRQPPAEPAAQPRGAGSASCSSAPPALHIWYVHKTENAHAASESSTAS